MHLIFYFACKNKPGFICRKKLRILNEDKSQYDPS